MRVRIPLSAPRNALASRSDETVGGVREDIHMYSRATVDIALRLSATGVMDRENAQICGVSIRTIRHWRYGSRRSKEASKREHEPRCPHCDGRPLDGAAYAYLLGLYLGDGHITQGRRSVYALSLTCCDSWPGLMAAAKAAMSVVMPTSSVFCVARAGCTEVKSTSTHWPCLFPQHGPGRKHARKIELALWQRTIVSAFPGAFARGLFHSDGCRFINRTSEIFGA